MNKGVNPGSLAKACECFERARAIDPDNVDAMLGLVFVDVISVATIGSIAISERLAEAEGVTLKALAAEPRNAMAHYCLGLILLFSRRAEQAIAELEQALALDRNLTFAHAQIGLAKTVLGHAEEMEGYVMEAMRLSPRDHGAYIWCDFLGIAKIVLQHPSGTPPSSRAQIIEIAHKDASLVGSRSASIGTPPSLAFSLLHQSARRDFVGGPARVLKHSRET